VANGNSRRKYEQEGKKKKTAPSYKLVAVRLLLPVAAGKNRGVTFSCT
jgi:hypothetical protein